MEQITTHPLLGDAERDSALRKLQKQLRTVQNTRAQLEGGDVADLTTATIGHLAKQPTPSPERHMRVSQQAARKLDMQRVVADDNYAILQDAGADDADDDDDDDDGDRQRLLTAAQRQLQRAPAVPRTTQPQERLQQVPDSV